MDRRASRPAVQRRTPQAPLIIGLLIVVALLMEGVPTREPGVGPGAPPTGGATALEVVPGATGAAIAVPSTAPPRQAPSSAATPAPRLPSPISTLSANTSRTLVLLNGTVENGNVLPPNDVAPAAIAWDPVDQSMWAVGQYLGVLNEITGTPQRVTASLALPSGSFDVAYVPGASLVYVTGGPSGNLSVVSTLTGTLVTTLHVGQDLQHVIYDPTTTYLYVTDSTANQVVIVDPSSEAVMGRVSVGSAPGPLALDTLTGLLYVGDTVANTVSIVNTSSLTVQATVAVGTNPSAIAFDALFQDVAVVNQGSDNVSLISSSSQTVVGNDPVGGSPDGIAVDPATGYLYVSDSATNNLTVRGISPTNPVVYSVPVGRAPAGVLYDTSNREMYVADARSGNLTEVGLPSRAVLGEVVTGVNSINDAYDPVNGELYVTDSRSDRVWAAYASNLTEITSIKVGGEPQGVAVDPTTDRIFVSDMFPTAYDPNGGVTVISGTNDTVIATLPAGKEPVGAVDDARTGEVYIENTLGNNVTVINATTLRTVTSVPVGNFPFGGTVDTSTGQVFIVDSSSGAVSVIDPTTHAVVSTVTVQAAPNDAAYNPVDHQVYVENSGTNTVSVVNGSTLSVTSSITVGPGPSSAAVDPANGFVEVAVENQALVAVVDPRTETVVAQYAVGASPAGITVDPATGFFFASNQDSGTLSASGLLVSTGFTAQPSPLTLGGTTQLSVTVPDGGVPLSYAYAGLPAGCFGGNRSTFGCVPTSAGTFHVTVAFWDTLGKSGSATTLLIVNPALTLNVSSLPPSVTEGSLVGLNVSSAGGTVPIRQMGLTGLPGTVGCPSFVPLRLFLLLCTTSVPGNFTATFWALDSGGANVSASASFTVNPSMVLASVAASPSSLGVGGLTHLTISVYGGTPPYTYAWQNLPSGCTTQNTSALACSPRSSGTLSVKVTVTDHGGGSLNASVPLTVYPPVTISSFGATPPSVTIGAMLSYSTVASGGASALSYLYLGLPPGCTSPNASTLSCTPTVEGTFATEVVVTDDAGDRVVAWTNVTVLPSSPLGQGGSDPYLWVVAALAIVVIGVVLVLVLRRRGGKRAAPVAAGTGAPDGEPGGVPYAVTPYPRAVPGPGPSAGGWPPAPPPP